MNCDDYNNQIAAFARQIREDKPAELKGTFKAGVDLGTANIVFSIVDDQNRPVAGKMVASKAIKDGIVVDYLKASSIVSEMKRSLERQLNREIHTAAAAIPPGILEGNAKVIANVLESAGLEVTSIVAEPTAAANLLGITDGAVVDVGGGTTGISILKEGQVIFTADEPTGGIHMTLVLAGAKKISIQEAEKIKCNPDMQPEVFPVIKPVVDKMAAIVEHYLTSYDTKDIYIVGGASCFDEFGRVFQKAIGRNIITPAEPLLITPLGIAMNSNLQ